MDNERIAKQLVKTAKELNDRKEGTKVAFPDDDFEAEYEEALTTFDNMKDRLRDLKDIVAVINNMIDKELKPANTDGVHAAFKESNMHDVVDEFFRVSESFKNIEEYLEKEAGIKLDEETEKIWKALR